MEDSLINEIQNETNRYILLLLYDMIYIFIIVQRE